MATGCPSMAFESQGRGGGYSWRRGLVETLLDHAYLGEWPAKLWGLTARSERVRAVRLEVEADIAEPLRVAFASDLHLGPTTSKKTLDRAFSILEDWQPDVLLLGGDYVFLHATAEKARELARRVSRVGAASAFAVLGNHDLWSTHGYLEEALGGAGAHVLVNASVRLPGPHGGVAIVGIDDPWTGSPDVARAFAGAEDAGAILVLCHAPEGLPLCSGRAFDLFLCGHTHGGQIATPFGAPVVPGRVGRRLVSGEHETHWGRAIVSRGVGATELPIRAWASPDVVLVDVISSRRSGK